MTLNKFSQFISIYILVFVALKCVSIQNNRCFKGQFSIGSMTFCQPYLGCSDFKNIKFVKLIGYGAVKWVFLAQWKGEHSIAVSIPRNVKLLPDFHSGLQVLRSLNPSQFVNQLVGYCERDNIIATEYHSLNNANSLGYILKSNIASFNLTTKLCVNFVQILNYVHNSPIGKRVNCDSDSVPKFLSQFLVTDTLSLVLNDVDALPEVTPNYSIICGRNIIRTPHSLTPPEIADSRNVGYSRGYTDKSDVWKVPDVCNYIFSSSGMNALHYSLYDVHKRCKNVNPSLRPTSNKLVELYQNLFSTLSN